jgi:hypothetical protein
VFRPNLAASADSVCELLVRKPEIENDAVRCSAQLSRPGLAPIDIWFKLPEEHMDAVTSRADPFIIASVFAAAETGSTLKVSGAPASPSLLRNLGEFQQVRRAWYGAAIVPIECETSPEEPRGDAPAIAAFSGGVDSAFTIYRHNRDRERPDRQQVTAALFVQGFDIALDDQAGFQGAFERAARMLDGLGVTLISMQTNVRTMCPDWEHMHAAAVAAALTVLSGHFATGLVASAGTYHLPLIPWGSNPLTDPMLGSRRFAIVHDGAASSRLEKVRALSEWPAAKELRFCFSQTPADGNCGRCLKCILTALEFKCAGVEPGCFAAPISDAQIVETLSRYVTDPHGDVCFREVLDAALEGGLTGAWLPVLQRVLPRAASN